MTTTLLLLNGDPFTTKVIATVLIVTVVIAYIILSIKMNRQKDRWNNFGK